MRLIDADAYAAEMKERQDACQVAIKGADGTERECWERAYAVFAEAKLTLDSMPTIGGWISVKDRLPSEEEVERTKFGFLCYIEGFFIMPDGFAILPYNKETKAFWSLYNNRAIDNVTHWMPLPKAPEEEVSGDAD